MVKDFCTIIIFAIGCIVAGCTSVSVSKNTQDVSPNSYTIIDGVRMERTVGKLRRLGMLPVQLKVSPENPKMCIEKCGWVGLDKVIRDEAAHFLHDRRGYEVVLLEELTLEKEAVFKIEELQVYARNFVEVIQSASPEMPAIQIDALAKTIGERAGVDGIVVIQGTATDLHLVDWLVLYGSFTLSAPLSYGRIGTSLRVDVFEASSGRNVWTSKLTSGGIPNAGEKYGVLLLDPIEPALPKAFIRSREGE